MIVNINYKSRIMNSKKIYIKSKYQDIQIPLMSVPISNARSKDNPFEFFYMTHQANMVYQSI